VTIPLWRIAVEAPTYTADDLSGAGAKITGGRWNSVGTPLIYSATNIALATIETVLHIRGGGLPFLTMSGPRASCSTRCLAAGMPCRAE
jgi:RES domain-containing protein